MIWDEAADKDEGETKEKKKVEEIEAIHIRYI